MKDLQERQHQRQDVEAVRAIGRAVGERLGKGREGARMKGFRGDQGVLLGTSGTAV